MNHENYIGKPLRDLVNDVPSFAINYYILHYKGNRYLKDSLNDEECLSRIIKKIDMINDTGYFSYPITLE